MKWYTALFLGGMLFFVQLLAAQTGTGYLILEEAFPDTSFLTDAFPVDVTPFKEDVKAIGMGRIGLLGYGKENAMLYNPAVLASPAWRFDLLNIGAGLPIHTLSAARFVKNNMEQFRYGNFFYLLQEGYNEFYNATTPAQQLQALQKIKIALQFPHDLVHTIAGTGEENRVHGLSILPSVQFQIGTIGFSLFSQAQLGFSVRPGESVEKLASMNIPQNPDDVTVETFRTMTEILNTLFDERGELSPTGLPQVTALSFIDIVGTLGYGYQFNEQLQIGANLKVVNRRFSAKNIDTENLNNVLGNSIKEMQVSVTGFTFDAGAIYTFSPSGAMAAVVLQNIIPMKNISSTAQFKFSLSETVLPVDANGDPYVGYLDGSGNFIPHPAGDTVVITAYQRAQVGVPFELRAPFLCHIGVKYPFSPQLDLALEFNDLFGNDKRYETTTERLRAGLEYRPFSVLALRIGYATADLTYGLGLNFYVLQIDGAVARDIFLGEKSYYLQTKIGI